jgi:hypothetical protein
MFLSGKDAALIVAVSGVTTLSVSFMLFFDELQINISLVGFLQGALTVALPTIGKDLNFRQASKLVH